MTLLTDDRHILVGDIPNWLTSMISRCPTPDTDTAATDWAHTAQHWIHCWAAAAGRPVPTMYEALDRFVATMRAEGDLSENQIAQVCHAVDPGRAPSLAEGIGAATERFLWRVRPWILPWISFAHWTVSWCTHRQRGHLLFLARDMLTTYLTARRLHQKTPSGLDIRLAHASRSDHGTLSDVLGLRTGEQYRPGRVALVDSGCYGTVMSRLAGQLDPAAVPEDEAACLFFFSRNPRIFGYLNYLLSPSILELDVAGTDVADFVIYAGDVLEAMPKPYRVVRSNGVLTTELQDLLTFCLGMAVLKEVDDFSVAGPPVTVPQAQRRALELYAAYAHAGRSRMLADSLLFHAPAPQQLPDSYGFASLDYQSFPPQNEIFGSAPG
ncbi:hypothetical protein G3I59_24695 [Amycolatopsis rubida]|uniref:Uncharacterized protein n=1 Tax=Amycolatopsis rubida TaxID=112413 RepID=A0ABX0BY12_9PSEU|nr:MULTISPECIES: hypothetical protein [Amycolatopsis]MYW93726.1 hypothetical protein [Amycolatopsis rubida]NEC58713.1 hypothetical protein [Amycolatopsis rubida]OAP22906.1 hypothetical protein A4R44_06368 [Amycolatopsis sp. M39]